MIGYNGRNAGRVLCTVRLGLNRLSVPYGAKGLYKSGDILLGDYIVNITADNAQQAIIAASQSMLVVVVFWSPSAEPSLPVVASLERIAHEYQGQFVLAKINTDEQAMLASQFGVRGVPTVMLVQHGQPVDGLSGPQTESVLREKLGQFLPKAWELALASIAELDEDRDHAKDLPTLRDIYNESGHAAKVGCYLAESLIELNRLTDAETVLSAVPVVDQEAHYQQLMAKLSLKKEAAKSPELIKLDAQFTADKNDLGNACSYAIALQQAGEHQKALDVLYHVLAKDLQFGEAKAQFLAIIAALGKGDPVATQYQKRFFTLLY